MTRLLLVSMILTVLGAIKLPIEHDLAVSHRQENFRGIEFNLDLREKLGQLGFVAALSGFRSIVADGLFIQAHVAWEQTEWGRVLLLFRQVTTLQPRSILFWDMAAWHMAWNASVAAMNDQTQPRLSLRVKAQREYFALGKDFLERGIKNNPMSAPTNFLRRPQSCPERQGTTGVFPPTNSPIARDGSGKRMSACASSTTRARRNGCRR